MPATVAHILQTPELSLAWNVIGQPSPDGFHTYSPRTGLVPEVAATNSRDRWPLILYGSELNSASVDVRWVAAARPPAHDLEAPVAAVEGPVVLAGLPVVPLAPPSRIEGPPPHPWPLLTFRMFAPVTLAYSIVTFGGATVSAQYAPPPGVAPHGDPAENSHRIYAAARSEKMSRIVECEHAAAVHVAIDIHGQRASACAATAGRGTQRRITAAAQLEASDKRRYQAATSTHPPRRTHDQSR